MKFKDLEVGDRVYIREDLKDGTKYSNFMYINEMGNGIKQVGGIYSDKGFNVIDGFGYVYTPEMIDWDKTIYLRWLGTLLGVYDEEDKQDKQDKQDFVHNPLHYGGGEKHDIECYKAIEYILDRLENVPQKYYGHVSNIVKYIWRCNDKNGYEDLDKVSVYLDFMFREEE